MSEKELSYLIIGAGGTGGAVGSYMAKAGKNVAFIARGSHLAAMKENGLRVIRPHDEFMLEQVRAFSMEEYLQSITRPDVVFVCVKGYSLDDTVPFISKIAGPETVVIPILNIYGTGARMQNQLPDVHVTDGCIYVASEIKEPGVILMNGEILRVVFGLRSEERAGDNKSVYSRLLQIEADLNDSGICGILSENIERDALIKFSYVSPQGACGLYYGVPAGAIQQPGSEERECFAGLVGEVCALAKAMGLDLGEDRAAKNLAILDELAPDMTTSLQRDVMAGRRSEIDGLIYEVVRMGDKYGVDLPFYNRIASALRSR